MQVQVLGLQDVSGGSRRACVVGAVGGSEPRQGGVWSGKDVVNAELDLRLGFALRVGVWRELVLPGS